MDNPFLAPSFKTEKDLKAGLNSDGLMPVNGGNDEPLTENPFIPGSRVSPQMSNPFLQEDTPMENPFTQDTPTPRTEDDGVLDKIKNYAGQAGVGTGIDVADMVSGLATMIPSGYAGLKAMLEGKSPEEAAKVIEDIRHKYSVRGFLEKQVGHELPHNPALAAFGEGTGAAAKNTMTLPSYLTQSGEPERIGNPVSDIFATDALNLSLGLKGAKKLNDEAFTGGEKDVTAQGSHEFVENPDNPFTQAINEQKAFSDKYGKHLPVLYKAGKEGEKVFEEPPKGPEGPAPEEGPSMSEKLADMREKGEQVLANAKEQGLSPKDIHDEFWENVYPKLPEEVQARFDKMAGRKDIKITSDIDTLERMSRWYVALMHEANNHPWNEKAATYLETKTDAYAASQLPTTYVDRTFTNSITLGKEAWSTTSFDPDGLIKYVEAVRDNQSGGSYNAVMTALAENSKDPFERLMARLVISLDNDAKFVVKKPSIADPVAYVDNSKPFGNADQNTLVAFVDGDAGKIAGMSPTTMIHEGLHNALLGVYELGRDPRSRDKYPVYARFFDEMSSLVVDIAKSLTTVEMDSWRYAFTEGGIEQSGTIGHEFMSMALSDPGFMRVLDRLEVDKNGQIMNSSIHGFMPHNTVYNIVFGAMKNVLLQNDVPPHLKERINAEFKGFLKGAVDARRTAFDEVVGLLLPILEYTKKNPYDPRDTKIILKGTNAASIDRRLTFAGGNTDVDLDTSSSEGTRSNAPTPRTVHDVIYNGPDYSGGKKGTVLHTYNNKNRARNKADLLDNEYGGYVHQVRSRPVEIPEENTPTFAPPSKIPPKVQAVMDRYVSPFNSFGELKTAIRDGITKGGLQNGVSLFMKQHPDIGIIYSNFAPTSMVPGNYNNPVATFFITKLREIEGDSHAIHRQLFGHLDRFFKKESPKDQADITSMLAQVNRPEWQQQIAQKREQQYGPTWKLTPGVWKLTPGDVPPVTVVSTHQLQLYHAKLEPAFEVMENLDRHSLKNGFNRDFRTEVFGYFPRYFGFGRFSVTGFDPATGKMSAYKRAKTFVEIRRYEEDMKGAGLFTKRDEGNDFAEVKGHLLNLLFLDPKSAIGKMAANSIAASEAHRRTQEFERKAFDVVGFIGQNINDPKEVKLLRISAYHRASQSAELYRAARIKSELLDPIRNDAFIATHWPNVVKFVEKVAASELGADISDFQAIDNGANWLLDKTHVAFLKSYSKHANDLGPNEMTISPTASKEYARLLTYSASAWALMLNVRNLAVNTLTIPFVSIFGGFPDAVLLRQNPAKAVYIATKSHVQSMADFALLRLGQAPADLRKFMDEADKRGWVAPNMFNDLPQLREEIEQPLHLRAVGGTLNAVRKVTNDPVEYATNYMSLLYYRRFFMNLAGGNLPTAKLYQHIEAWTKRYTGDYRAFNKQLMYKRAGVVGQTFSNFSIWTGHRVAQGLELMKGAATRAAIMPMVALMAVSLIVAGVKGMVGAQDYENFRQWGLNTKYHDKPLFELPPINLVLRRMDAPDFLYDGLQNRTGIDISASGKWAGITDISGITWMMPGKIYDIARWIYKDNVHVEGKVLGRYQYEGPDLEDDASLVQALPPVAQGVARQHLLTRNFRPDRATVLSKKGNPTYTQMDNEVKYNLLNFRTVRQSRESDEAFNKLYEKSSYEHERDSLKKAALEQLIHSLNERNMGNPKRADQLMKTARNNFERLAKVDPDGFKNLRTEVLQGITKETDTTYERTIKEMAHSRDAGMIIMLMNSIKTMDQSRTISAPSSPSPTK